MEGWKSKTIGEALDEVAGACPDKEALVFRDQRISFRELRDNADRFAKGLMHLGVRKGDKVAIWMNNNPEWVYAWFGSAKAGSVAVSVNARFKSREVRYALSQSDSTTLILNDFLHKTNYLEEIEALCPELKTSARGGLSSRTFPLLKNVVCASEKSYPGAFSFREVMEAGGEKISDRELLERQHAVGPDDIAMIQYTSGTTSFPKGCMLAHGQILLDVLAMGGNMAITSDDRFYCALPFHHVGGILITSLMVLVRRGTVVLTDHFAPEEALRIIEKERCTGMNGVETMWLEMYSNPRYGRYDTGSLKKGWAIGPPELLRNVAEKMKVERFVNTYGLSEQTANTGTTQADDPLEYKILWNGRPHAGTEMKIIDRATGRTAPFGEEGEICVRGFNVMKGYYKMPDETARVIDGEGWLHTGDTGIMDGEGNFRFTGRVKDLLRVGGENVSALEVENFLLAHPAVRQVQVVGVPDPRLVEVPVALVQLHDGEALSEQEVIGYCRGRLSSFKVPRRVWFVETFPTTGSGKIQKYKLREEAARRLASPE